MIIKSIVFNDFQENTYILHDETKECIIIDCGCNSDQENNELDSYISNNLLKPVKLLNTHGHIDHILGNSFAKEKYKIQLYMHEADIIFVEEAFDYGGFFDLDMVEPPLPDSFLNDNDNISFGNSQLKIFHVPGHSPGSVAFYSNEEKFVIVGDVLFKGSIGRTDLPGGNYNTLITGIRTKLFTLDDNVVVYPGHGEKTNIGYEKRNNPFLNV